MKLIGCVTILAVLSLSSSPTTSPQEEAEPGPGEAETIDGLVAALYRSVSFDPGGEPDWQLLRSLCYEGALFVQPARGPEGPQSLDADGFVALFKSDMERGDMERTGFHETVAAQETSSFGDIAHVFVVFEARFDPASEEPVARGLDSIQLVRHAERWWIAAITTDFERPGKPLPERFLRGGKEAR